MKTSTIRKFGALFLALSLTALSACSGAKNPAGSKAPGATQGQTPGQTQSRGKTLRVALATATGGLGDRSFNDSAWEGFKRAERELGVEIKVVEPQSVADYASALTALADGGYDLIMAAGNDWVETVNTIAPKYPEVKFVGVNIACTLDNVAVAKFSDFEAGYMAGALAAMMSKTGTIGYLGGLDVPAIQRFLVGYRRAPSTPCPASKYSPPLLARSTIPARARSSPWISSTRRPT